MSTATPKGFVSRPSFDDYREKFAAHFKMERSDGILQVQMHSNGGSVMYGMQMHNAWSQLWMDVGNDPENEVLIFGGSGDQWIAGLIPRWRDNLSMRCPATSSTTNSTTTRPNCSRRSSSISSIPTIACINGPGLHTEFALLCDITLCADHAELFDPHFRFNLVPGDGQGLTFQELMGPKRAAYYLYTSDKINAQTAKELGLVNEVVSLEHLYPRAHEIAAKIMQKPRSIRRLTTAVLKRQWKRRLVQDLGFHVAHELLGMHMSKPTIK